MGIIESILEIGSKIFDRVIPDTNKRQEAKEALEMALAGQDFQLAIEQIKINAVEAQNGNIFVSGWRPFVGWVCGVAFGLHFLIFPIVDKIITIFGGTPIGIPFDMDTLLYALGGLLGLGGFRSYEKVKGVASK